mmetsp:Transcript_13150/g.17327  ORF Transcript_13150/g.17327 Transcript_13150/m.17327 type:complete len:564 (-) Transcript_13150:413-2104(-)
MDSKVVGVLGGGQLGRMMAEAGHRLGVQLAVLDPGGSDSPAGQVAKFAIEGSFRDEEKIRELANISDVLTVEIEHVNCDILEAVESTGKPVHPSPGTVRLIQDKHQQKVHLKQHGVPTPDFRDCPDLEAAKAAGEAFGYPLMLKAKRLAYDGRGNAVAQSEDEISSCFDKLGGVDIYAERWCPFEKELAVMVVRTPDNKVVSYPVVETVQKDNICHTTLCPVEISAQAAKEAERVASAAISCLSGAGIFGVELFLLSDDSVLLNEIAPRPHNSGHYTIEACECDQFENHLRAVLGLPLGSCKMRVGAALMLNILGGESMEETMAPMKDALSIPGAGLHWYGKAESRKGRKMGHITFTADSLPELQSRVSKLNLGLMGGTAAKAPLVGVIMGSDSDLPTMKAACDVLENFGIPFECTIVSAHRTSARMFTYAQGAAARGLRIIIAGAGGAAHLPGMCAALTPLPVIGVPVKTSTLSGVDSLHSIVQMPRGVPVATVAIGNAMNAGLLAVRMLGMSRPDILTAMDSYLKDAEEEVTNKAASLEELGYKAYLEQKMSKKASTTVGI